MGKESVAAEAVGTTNVIVFHGCQTRTRVATFSRKALLLSLTRTKRPQAFLKVFSQGYSIT